MNPSIYTNAASDSEIRIIYTKFWTEKQYLIISVFLQEFTRKNPSQNKIKKDARKIEIGPKSIN